MTRNFEGLTVGELIDQLREFNPNSYVGFSYNYGDHWRTQVVADVSNVEETEVTYSGYHNMFRVADNSHDDEEEMDTPEEERQYVIVLS